MDVLTPKELKSNEDYEIFNPLKNAPIEYNEEEEDDLNIDTDTDTDNELNQNLNIITNDNVSNNDNISFQDYDVPNSSAIVSLNKDLDDIENLLNKQISLKDTLSSQGNYVKFVDDRFDKLDNLAKQLEIKKEKDNKDIITMNDEAYNKLNYLDQKIDRLIEENKTKQSSLEEAIRDLIKTLQEKNKTIITKEPTPENLSQIIKEVDQNIDDLDNFKTLDIDPETININKNSIRNNIRNKLREIDEISTDNQVNYIEPVIENIDPINEEVNNIEQINDIEPIIKVNDEVDDFEPVNEEVETIFKPLAQIEAETDNNYIVKNVDSDMSNNDIIQKIDKNMEKIHKNQEQLKIARELLEKFKDDYENTLIQIIEKTPSQNSKSQINQEKKEIEKLKENQKIIKEVIKQGKIECPLVPTKSNIGNKQKKVASLCTELNHKKLNEMNMIDGIVKKHIQKRHRYTKKYTNKIRRELNTLRRKVARRNVEIAILLDQL